MCVCVCVCFDREQSEAKGMQSHTYPPTQSGQPYIPTPPTHPPTHTPTPSGQPYIPTPPTHPPSHPPHQDSHTYQVFDARHQFIGIANQISGTTLALVVHGLGLLLQHLPREERKAGKEGGDRGGRRRGKERGGERRRGVRGVLRRVREPRAIVTNAE